MIISIINHKGGTGKTTTTINLGSALAKLGQQVLLIDLDAQGNLSYSLGANESNHSVAELLLRETTVQEVIQEHVDLHIVPASEALADVELTLARLEERFYHVKNMIKSIPSFDFTLIDCPPSLSLITINALTASDFILVPMQMDVLALRGLDSILNTVEKVKLLNPKISVLGVLPVMIDTRKNIHQEIINHIKSNYQVELFHTSIRSCVKAAEAPSFGKSVIDYAPTCSTAIDYALLANEVLKIVSIKCTQQELHEV